MADGLGMWAKMCRIVMNVRMFSFTAVSMSPPCMKYIGDWWLVSLKVLEVEHEIQ